MMRGAGWIALCVSLGAAGCGVGVPSSRPGAPPDVAAPTPMGVQALGEVERLQNGLQIVRRVDATGSFRALLVVAAGPADDPAGEPGLTELAVEMALEETTGSAGATDGRPRDRIRRLGGRLSSVANGNVSGWALAGPAGSAADMTDVLADLMLAPTFPATRLAAVATRTRESFQASDNDIVMTAIAIASGVAVGRAKLMRLRATGPQLGRLNRETVVRFWEALWRPKRVALVLAGPRTALDAATQRVRARLATLGSGAKPSADRLGEAAPTSLSACQPGRRSTHLVLNPAGGTQRLFTLVAIPAPGRGDPGRAAIESAVAAMSTSPTGQFARRLGPDRAYQAAPRIIDLGYGDGRGVSILLMRVSGARRAALRELFTVLDMLNALAKTPPQGEALQTARHNARTRQLLTLESPMVGLAEVAAATLYRPPQGAKQPSFEAVVRDTFDPSNWVVVGVGPTELSALLQRLGQMSAWNSVGRFVGGERPPGCKRRAN